MGHRTVFRKKRIRSKTGAGRQLTIISLGLSSVTIGLDVAASPKEGLSFPECLLRRIPPFIILDPSTRTRIYPNVHPLLSDQYLSKRIVSFPGGQPIRTDYRGYSLSMIYATLMIDCALEKL